MRLTFFGRRNGSVLAYIAIAMVAFSALVSLAIDLAHVRLDKMQLQFAADAAARSGVSGLISGTAMNNAISAAASLSADATPVVVLPADVVLGTWANSVFTPGGTPANAVSVTVARTAARGNAVVVWWGSLIGITSCDVTVNSIAYGKPTPMAGFIGYSGVDYKNNSFYGSYDSRTTTLPTQSNAGSNARLGSNTSISGVNNNILAGDAVLGASAANPTGITVSGSNLYQSSALPTPTMPPWSPPSGGVTDLVVSSNTVLPGGSYWLSSMSINADLTFSGPATVYVNGPILIAANLASASGVPKDLLIYQYGANSFGDSNNNGMNITASVLAPYSDFLTKNNLNYYGSGVFNTITTKNNANFFYDTTLGPADGSYIVSVVK